MSWSKYEQYLLGLLKTTQEDYILVQKWAIDTSLRVSHSCAHSFHSTQPKDTPLKLLVFIQTTIPQHGFKSVATKVSIPNTYLSFYMPLFLQLGLFFSLSFININPLQFLSFLRLFAHYVKSLVQRNSTTINIVVHLLIFLKTARKKKNIREKENPTCMVLQICFFSYLPPSYYANLHSMLQLPSPSIVRCRFVLHNT
jgi:hypothetical protein